MRYNYVLRAHLSFSPMIISLRLPCHAPKIMPHDSVSLYRAALSLNLSCYSDLSLLKLLVMCKGLHMMPNSRRVAVACPFA